MRERGGVGKFKDRLGIGVRIFAVAYGEFKIVETNGVVFVCSAEYIIESLRMADIEARTRNCFERCRLVKGIAE